MKPYLLKLDLQCFAQEKTEKATPRKLQDARKKGEVAKSIEVPGAFILLSVFLFLLMFGGFLKDKLIALFSISFLEYMTWQLTQENLFVIFGNVLFEFLMMLAPILIIVMVVAVVGNYIQFGFLLTGEPLKLKLQKLDPIKGAKRIFAMRAIVEFLKSILKFIIVGSVVAFILWNRRMEIVNLSSLTVEEIMRFAGQVVVTAGLTIAVILIFLSILDYMYQKYEFNKNQKMSKQEVKDEHKKTEGDPLIKGKIREKQRRMAMQRMMQEIPNADVIITNPTHFAVAIRYDAEEMDAPKVIAKGKDYIALKIKQLAKEHQIITMENKPLARALYEQVDIGELIPNDLFQAVAEVLAYVYRVKKKV